MPISFLKDFDFCPRSIYFHQIYGNISPTLYHGEDQLRGLAAHKNIDSGTYTTAKAVLQALPVYSEKYKLFGKIDLYHNTHQILTEQKEKITKVYPGLIFQLYAQYFCLTEMGFVVKKMRLYSKRDNKIYAVKKPQDYPDMLQAFEKCIENLRQFDLYAPFYTEPS